MTRLSLILLTLIFTALSQDAPGGHAILERRYVEGEHLRYLMKASNDDDHYEAQADGIVKKDPAGNFIEEYSWSNVVYNGKHIDIPAPAAEFRQTVTLDPRLRTTIPNLAKAHPSLIGPITDFLTYYIDLSFAIRNNLKRPGDHFYQKSGIPASWADGSYVVLGESSIDFDITLVSIDEAAQIATIRVKHVPPERPQVRLSADWMREPVAGSPNNWVEVSHAGEIFHAAVGRETFDVEIKSGLKDGRILSATMNNPVETKMRDCKDAALTMCSSAQPHHILRQVEIKLAEQSQ